MNYLPALAPYGLGPLVAAYGAARGARAAYSSVSRRPAYRKTRRVPRSLRIKGLHTFRRSTSFQLGYTPTTGFTSGALVGFNAAMTFSLSEIRVYLGAGSVVTAVPNSADFSSLFDAWRIKSATVNVFFQNTSSTTATNTTNMPLLVYTWDKEDHSLETITGLDQHERSKRYQFGNGASRTGALISRGMPQGTSTGPLTNGGSAGLKVEPRSVWFETSQPTVEHNCFKFDVDGFSASQATNEGNFAIYVDVVYELKDVI